MYSSYNGGKVKLSHMFPAKPIRAGGGHLVGGAPGVVRPQPAQDIKRKSIIVGARGQYTNHLPSMPLSSEIFGYRRDTS